MIHEFKDRIPFAHIRNVKIYDNGDLSKPHRSRMGVDIAGVVEAYHDIGYEGYARPDHGRHLWGEQCHSGYGLYDRALGIMYLWALGFPAKEGKSMSEHQYERSSVLKAEQL